MTDFSKRLAQKALDAQKLLTGDTKEIAPRESGQLQTKDLNKVIDNILADASPTDFPPLLQQALNSINNRTASPSVLLAPFKRAGIHSRLKTYQAENEEARTLISQMNIQHEAFQLSVQNAQLPDKLKDEFQLRKGTHQVQMLALAQQAAAVAIQTELIKRASQEGLSLEHYLTKLLHQMEAEKREVEVQQDIQRDKELKANERAYQRDLAADQIEMLTNAKLASRQMEKRLREELRQVLVREDELQADAGMSERLKKKLLAEARDEIESLKRRINELSQDAGKTDIG